MAGIIITDSIEQLQTRQGFIQMSINNFDLTGISIITAGSRIEIAGALIKFTSTESMGSNWSSMATGTVYAYINGVSLLSVYTQTAPVWNSELQGWYDVTGANRYYAKLFKTSGSLYTEKRLYTNLQTVLVSGRGLIESSAQKIRGSLFTDSTTLGALWTLLNPLIPNTGDSIFLHGSGEAGIYFYFSFSHAVRDGANIILYGNYGYAGSITTYSGDTTSFIRVGMAW
jgi:hypothetical protein